MAEDRYTGKAKSIGKTLGCRKTLRNKPRIYNREADMESTRLPKLIRPSHLWVDSKMQVPKVCSFDAMHNDRLYKA